MNNEIFKIVGSVLLEDEAFVNGIKNIMNKAEDTSNKLAEKFNKMGDAISNAGSKMTLGLTTPIAGLTTAGIKYNMEMESLETNLSVLLGSTEKASAKLEELRTMGAKTPFETTDLVKATQKMLAFGLDATKTNGYLQMLGDIAMGDANKLDSLTLAFSQIGASGRASMEDINQMIDQGFNPLTYVAKKTGESMADVRQRVSDGAVSFEEIASAMTDATSKGGAFYGSMDKASETTAGRISTLKDNIGVMLGTLTTSLMPIFEKIVDKIAEWVEWFSKLDSGTQETIMNILLLVGALGPVLIIFGKIVSGVGTVISIFSKLKTIITGSAMAMKVLGAVGTFLTGPVGIIIAVVGGLIAVFVLLWNKCDAFREFWINLWDSIKEWTGNAVEGIKKGIEGIKEGFNAFIEFLSGIPNWINDNIIQPVIDFFVALGNGIKAVFDGIVLAIQTFIMVIVMIFQTAFTLITLPYRFIWENCKDFILDFIEGAIEIINSFINWIVDGFNWLKEQILAFIDIVKEFINGIVLWVIDIFNWFKEQVSIIWGLIKEHIIQPVIDLYNIIKNYVSLLIAWCVDMFEKFKQKIYTIMWLIREFIVKPIIDTYNSVVKWVKDLVASVIDKFNEFKEKVAKIFNDIKDAIVKKFNEAKEKVTGFVNKIRGNIVDSFNDAKEKVTKTFNKIKESITAPIKEAMDTVKGYIDKIKGFFTNFMAKIKLPHFSISNASLNPKDWIEKGLPKLSVDWYAKGGIFDKPTIFNTPSGAKGVGEAGPEAVTPISKLQDYIKIANKESDSGIVEKMDLLIEILLKYLPYLMARQNVVLDNGVLVGQLIGDIDIELGKLKNRRKRG